MTILRSTTSRILTGIVFLSPLLGQESAKQTTTLKAVLSEQLRSTHNQPDWFVPANVAVRGLTAEQASWVDGHGNHSIGQLANHLIFWNTRQLAKLKGEPLAKYSGDNDETFNRFDAKKWSETVRQLDEIMVEFEKTVESADEKQLLTWASAIAHIGTHNAYHVGQIVYIRKPQGLWDPSNGVK